MRQVQARLPDGRRCDGQFEKEREWHGVHPVHGVREKLPQRGTMTGSKDGREKQKTDRSGKEKAGSF